MRQWRKWISWILGEFWSSESLIWWGCALQRDSAPGSRSFLFPSFPAGVVGADLSASTKQPTCIISRDKSWKWKFKLQRGETFVIEAEQLKKQKQRGEKNAWNRLMKTPGTRSLRLPVAIQRCSFGGHEDGHTAPATKAQQLPAAWCFLHRKGPLLEAQ